MSVIGFVFNKDNKIDFLNDLAFLNKIKYKLNLEKSYLGVINLTDISDGYKDNILRYSKNLNKIYFFNVKNLNQLYLPVAIVNILINIFSSVIKDDEFTYISLQANDITNEVSPFIASFLNYGIATNLIDIDLIDDNVLFKSFSYGSKSISSFIIKSSKILLTFKPNYFEFSEDINYSSPIFEEIDINYEEKFNKIKVYNINKVEKIGPKLEEARIIVSGGRGLGSKEGFALLRELANLLGGAVGASRAAVDANWIEPNLQIGQTGKTVSPDLYIAIGISGATQHIAGMNKSKVIVAINNDKEAPIFKYSHIGIVEDYKVILPAIINEIKKLKT